MGSLFHFLSERGITLGTLQRCLIVFSDCITAVYGFIFSALVFGEYNEKFGSSLGIGYAAVWMIGELVSMLTTIWQRYLSFNAETASDGKKLEKMFTLKILGVFHYLLITVGTAGLVSAYRFESGGHANDVSFMFRAISLSLYVTCWMFTLIVVTVLCMMFSVHWGVNPINMKSGAAIERCTKTGYGMAVPLPCIYYPIVLVVMIVNQVIRILLCPFFYAEAYFTGVWKFLAFLPVVVLNLATLPVRIISVFTALLLQAVGWVLFILTCGSIIPLAQWIVGKSVVVNILDTRQRLWQGHPMRFFPAILPLAVYTLGMVGPTLLGIAIIVYVLSLFNDSDQPSYFLFEVWKKYTDLCADTITGNNHGLGFRLDAILTGIILCIIMIPGLIFISFWVMTVSRPSTLNTVCTALLGADFGAVWITFKVLQTIVSVLYPLLRLYAFGLLGKFQRLLVQYADVVLIRFVVEFEEVRLAYLGILIEVLKKILADGNRNDLLNEVQRRLDETSETLRKQQEHVANLKQLLDDVLEGMEENMKAIASILFDFDFTLKSIEKGSDPTEQYDDKMKNVVGVDGANDEA